MLNKTLPNERAINRLSNIIDHYPIDLGRLRRLAKRSGLAPRIIKLIDDFPDDTVFSSQTDLETRLTDLEIILTQAQEEPAELPELYEED